MAVTSPPVICTTAARVHHPAVHFSPLCSVVSIYRLNCWSRRCFLTAQENVPEVNGQHMEFM